MREKGRAIDCQLGVTACTVSTHKVSVYVCLCLYVGGGWGGLQPYLILGTTELLKNSHTVPLFVGAIDAEVSRLQRTF